MARELAVKVHGLKELRRDLRRQDPDTVKEIRETLRRAAGLVARQAATIAPRRTGRLAESYRPFTRGNIAGVRSALPYAAVHEYGGTISPRGVPIVIRRTAPVSRVVMRETESIVRELEDGIMDVARRHGW